MLAAITFALAMMQGEDLLQSAPTVTLSADGADVRGLVRAMMTGAKIKYNIAPPVKGEATIELFDTPLARALTQVLRQSDAGYYVEDSTVMVESLHPRSSSLAGYEPGRMSRKLSIAPKEISLKAGGSVAESYEWLQKCAKRSKLPVGEVMYQVANGSQVWNGYAVAFPLERLGADYKALGKERRFDPLLRVNGLNFRCLASALDPAESDAFGARIVVVEVVAEGIVNKEGNPVPVNHPTAETYFWSGAPKMTFTVYDVRPREDRQGFRWLVDRDKEVSAAQHLADFGLWTEGKVELIKETTDPVGSR